MQYLNERKGETLVVEDAFYKTYSTTRGDRTMLIYPVLLTFRALGRDKERRVQEGIPFKHSTAYSILDTEAESEKIRMKGLGFWDEEKQEDITLEVIENFLSTHKRRDRDFIQIDSRGMWVPREDFVKAGGTLLCVLCDQHLLGEHAMEQHKISPQHLQNELDAKDAELATPKVLPKAKAKKAVEATA